MILGAARDAIDQQDYFFQAWTWHHWLILGLILLGAMGVVMWDAYYGRRHGR